MQLDDLSPFKICYKIPAVFLVLMYLDFQVFRSTRIISIAKGCYDGFWGVPSTKEMPFFNKKYMGYPFSQNVLHWRVKFCDPRRSIPSQHFIDNLILSDVYLLLLYWVSCSTVLSWRLLHDLFVFFFSPSTLLEAELRFKNKLYGYLW